MSTSRAAAVIVLVHGAWHGGWCWRRVAPVLRAEGHEVNTPTLTGLGERAHLARPDVTLETHVEDVVALLEAEDLRDVVLVGHSSGGVVVTGVAERAAGRLARLVLLDAFVPAAGESVLGLLPEARRAHFEAQARTAGDGWRIPLDWRAALAGWGVTDEADVAWMEPRLRPQPLATMDRGPASVAAAEALPRSFVHCTLKPAGDAFARFAERARAQDLPVHELAAGHDAMVTHPQAVAGLVLA